MCTYLSDGRTRNEIDYICIDRRWRSALLDVRGYRGADIGSDHNLVLGKFRVKFKKLQKQNNTPKPFDVKKVELFM